MLSSSSLPAHHNASGVRLGADAWRPNLRLLSNSSQLHFPLPFPAQNLSFIVSYICDIKVALQLTVQNIKAEDGE
jgi:hypothetical protein